MGDEKLIIISVAVGGINDIFADNEHTHNQDSFLGGGGIPTQNWCRLLYLDNDVFGTE